MGSDGKLAFAEVGGDVDVVKKRVLEALETAKKKKKTSAPADPGEPKKPSSEPEY